MNEGGLGRVQRLRWHTPQTSVVARAEDLAEDLFRQESAATEAPLGAIQELEAEGYLTAPLPVRLGGLGLGTEAGGHLPLLRVLAAFGGADLALGRLYEGHVNALLLVFAYGTSQQRERAAEHARAGKLFAVWNTGESRPMRLEAYAGGLRLLGCKTFATGAGLVERPIVTAKRIGWQMTLPRMESPGVAEKVRLDRNSWQPLGMETSQSLTVDFGGATIDATDLLGKPGDFYREPLYRGGAVRFAAVQAGALLRLAGLFADWLTARGRQSDAYQIARLGEMELLAQDTALWVERAGATAEACMTPHASAERIQCMVRCGNMTRLAIERAAIAMMGHLVPGIGANGLLRPARFERIVRDLTMYLRQPNPDGTLADVGRSALQGDRAGYWSDPDNASVTTSKL